MKNEITLSEFLRLYNSIYQGCLLYIARHFPQFEDEEARDICSDTMTKAFSRFHTYDPAKGAFTTWLYTIASNTAIDHANDSKRGLGTTLSLPNPVSEDDTPFNSDIVDADTKNPMDLILEKEREEKKLVCVKKLTEEEQLILSMREEGRPFNEIAQQLGIPSTTARTKSRRATHKLKKMMETSDELS